MVKTRELRSMRGLGVAMAAVWAVVCVSAQFIGIGGAQAAKGITMSNSSGYSSVCGTAIRLISG
jgi:hypothetical protein